MMAKIHINKSNPNNNGFDCVLPHVLYIFTVGARIQKVAIPQMFLSHILFHLYILLSKSYVWFCRSRDDFIQFVRFHLHLDLSINRIQKNVHTCSFWCIPFTLQLSFLFASHGFCLQSEYFCVNVFHFSEHCY